MSLTNHIRLILGLLLLLAAGRVKADGPLRFTNTAWASVQFGKVFKVTRTDDEMNIYLITPRKSNSMNSVVFDLGATSQPGVRAWGWVPQEPKFAGIEWAPEFKWHLSLAPMNSDDDTVDLNAMVQSPDFVILPRDGSTPTVVTPSSTLSMTSTATIPIPTQSNTPPPSAISPGESMSIGTEAGIGIGSAAAGLLLIALVAWIIFRYRRGKHEGHLTLYNGPPKSQPVRVSEYNIPSLIPDCPASPAAPPYAAGPATPFLAAKRDQSPVFELPGGHPSQSVELSGSSSRPAELTASLSFHSSPTVAYFSSSPTVANSPGHAEGNASRPDNVRHSMPASDVDWRYDPMGGSYSTSPPASPNHILPDQHY
ncbi:hypothetical protein QBC37DRAFT_380744 [Rhypophila decipiens]|uniref:Uncharacterized protein n=1 Tax=Rhypophila decipiens TaxID=261697 RepID=A0AAN7B0V3_9PEZI|nr:hypothetical protein QBC37DRAFT_380744 [Rhypophila decipiens]